MDAAARSFFLHIEAAGGFVLLACTVIALSIANSPWAARFAELLQTRAKFTVGSFAQYKPWLLWINDGQECPSCTGQGREPNFRSIQTATASAT